MRIYRFDESVSRPAAFGDPSVRLSPLATLEAAASCSLLHLAPGASLDQVGGRGRLLAVVSGSCLARGSAEGAGHVSGERPLGPFAAAWFEEGEGHSVRTEDGLRALLLEGAVRPSAFAVSREIAVVDYDPAWPSLFGRLHDFVWPAVFDLALRLEHVGSTSVPGLAAKPVIDADVVVASPEQVPVAIEALAKIGYSWRGDLGVAGREAFSPPEEAGLPPHHLYLVVEGSRPHLDHVLLAGLLRQDASARRAYGELKRLNAARGGGDIDRYVAAKASFVASLLARARAEAGLEPVDYWLPEAAGLTSENSSPA